MGFHYCQDHVLTAGGSKWDVQAEWELVGKSTPPSPGNRIRFTLDLSSIDADWQTAIARARKLEPALVDGIAARVSLEDVHLRFSTVDETAPSGDASFLATVDQPIRFPRSLDDADFVKALARAGQLAGTLRIQADEIDVTERYWIFPIRGIGMSGVIVDRTTGHAFTTGGGMDRSEWIWAYEHRLLDEPAGDLVIEQVFDPNLAYVVARRFARIRRQDLEKLPLVLEGSATWLATRVLKEASTAIRWSVVPKH